MKITPNFQWEEFHCNDKKLTPYPHQWIKFRLVPLCRALEKIRKTVGGQVVITSGYRTLEYNAAIKKAAKDSWHCKGLAVDFKCPGRVGPRELYMVVNGMIERGEIPDGGLGSYPHHVHYDFGPSRRWYESERGTT